MHSVQAPKEVVFFKVDVQERVNKELNLGTTFYMNAWFGYLATLVT